MFSRTLRLSTSPPSRSPPLAVNYGSGMRCFSLLDYSHLISSSQWFLTDISRVARNQDVCRKDGSIILDNTACWGTFVFFSLFIPVVAGIWPLIFTDAMIAWLILQTSPPLYIQWSTPKRPMVARGIRSATQSNAIVRPFWQLSYDQFRLLILWSREMVGGGLNLRIQQTKENQQNRLHIWSTLESLKPADPKLANSLYLYWKHISHIM